MISDKEPALKKFAEGLAFPHESHVYRKNNIQLKLPENAHHIQHTNKVCRDLREFLAKTRTSTRYLPAMLTLFCWLHNTGGSEDAIRDLFYILTKPGLGEFTEDDFESFFAVPNYYVQLLDEENPLSKIPYNNLLMYYLYAIRQDKLKNGQENKAMPMKEICSICGCTDRTVRRNYKKFFSAGFDELIRTYFSTQHEKEYAKKSEKKNSLNHDNNIVIIPQNKEIVMEESISPEDLAMYDDWLAQYKLEPKKRLTRAEFLKIENKKFGGRL